MISVAEEIKPTFIALTETHLHQQDPMNLQGYRIMRNDRSEYGGGIMFAYKERLENIVLELEQVTEHYEGIWVELNNGIGKLRLGVVYFPQETESKTKIEKAYHALQESITKNKKECANIFVIGDFNAKMGRGDAEEIQSRAGQIMKKFIEHNNLVVLNHSGITTGRWTRVEGRQKSEIDYVMALNGMTAPITQITIDEDKLFSLHYHKKVEGCTKLVYSDHNSILVHINWRALVSTLQENTTKYVMTNEGYNRFTKELQERQLHIEIDKTNDVEHEYNLFTDKIINTLNKCKKKIKIGNVWKVNRILINQIKYVKNKIRTRKTTKDELSVLKVRLELLKEHCNEQLKERNQKAVKNIVNKISETGKTDLSAFWDYNKKNKIQGNHRSAIIDEVGNRFEGENDIKRVYKEYYTNLLKTPAASCIEEKEAEDIVDIGMNGLKFMWDCRLNKGEDEGELKECIRKACKELKTKKAQDQSGWKNEVIIFGGESIVSGLATLFKMMKEQKLVPKVWLNTRIKSIPKDNSKKIERRRGLFLTNVLSKVMERTIRIKNEQNMQAQSQFQCGGIKGRSSIDHLFTILSIIQRNSYLKRPTYCVFIDLEKCFDHLWLEDSIVTLWNSGLKVDDLNMLWEMNKSAKIEVHTPVGITEEFTTGSTVKQGTIYGPIVCGRVTEQVNGVGKKNVYMYGPRIEIGALVYVDDMSNAGDKEAGEVFVENCAIFERRKKATVNLDKSGYVIVNGDKNSALIETEVKRGRLKKNNEMKYVGTWISNKDTYEINIDKSKGSVENLIVKVKCMASESKVGNLATLLKLELHEKVICPSLHDNIQAWPAFTTTEIKKLESRQGQVLRRLLGLPQSTSYFGILYETGIWTVEAKIFYKKLMLLHNMVKSDDERLIKKVVLEQEKYYLKGSWWQLLKEEAAKYKIEIGTASIKKYSKQKFKKEIKAIIESHIVADILENVSTKMRSVVMNPWGRKPYLEGQLNSQQVKEIMLIKLHMVDLHENYKRGKTCDFFHRSPETT